MSRHARADQAPRETKSRGKTVTNIVEALREDILAGVLQPGKTIRQSELADQLGVSRQPVREALRELGREGLIELNPNSSAKVVGLDSGELLEIYWLRATLESAAIAQAVPNFTGADLDKMRALHDQMVSLAEDGGDDSSGYHTIESYLDLDRRFHQLALGRSQMPQLEKIVGDLWDRAGRYRHIYASLNQSHAFTTSNDEHLRIWRALMDRESKTAQDELANHILRTRDELQLHIFGDRASNELTRPGWNS